MGVGVSNWRLARRVAESGEFGVVSGTGIDTVVVRELQRGDPHGRLRVLQDYPDQDVVAHLSERFYVPGGLASGEPFRLLPMHSFHGSTLSQRMLSAATYSEVALARQGHTERTGPELPLFTAGDGILELELATADEPHYSATDVIEYLRGE